MRGKCSEVLTGMLYLICDSEHPMEDRGQRFCHTLNLQNPEEEGYAMDKNR